METLNVKRNLSDQLYRYEMLKILVECEAKGNEIRTVSSIKMVEITKTLIRSPTYPTKYCGFELGAKTLFIAKNKSYIAKGSHEEAKFQDLLDGFIRRILLCPSCGNSETVLECLQNKGVITIKCKACDYSRRLDNLHNLITIECKACGYCGQLDKSHKLYNFILKFPPGHDPNVNVEVQAGKKEKREGGDEKEKKKNRTDDGSPRDLDQQVQKKDKSRSSNDDWYDNTDADAVEKRMEMLSTGSRKLILSDDLQKSEQERLDLFHGYIKKHLENKTLNNSKNEIVAEAERLEIKDKAPLVLCKLLFNKNVIQQLKSKRVLFLRFTNENRKAQKYLLGGLEQVVELHRDALMSRVHHILNAFYQADILEEEVILEWSEKISKRYVSERIAHEIREQTQPFIKWLKTAEEEDEEETVEVVFSGSHINTSLKEIMNEPNT